MNGINITFSLTNEPKFVISVNFDSPNDESCQLFALFLHSIEKEQPRTFDEIITQLGENLKKDQNLAQTIQTIFDYKKEIGNTSDKVAIRPSQVFRFRPQ